MTSYFQAGSCTIPFSNVSYLREDNVYGDVCVYLKDNRSITVKHSDGAQRLVAEYKKWLEGGDQ